MAIGLNYSDHAAEIGAKALRTGRCLVRRKALPHRSAGATTSVTSGSAKTDWEVELGVVIGRPAKYVSEAEALGYVAGYCTINDVSHAEAFQTEGTGPVGQGQGSRHVRADRPLVTADEVADPQNLADLWLEGRCGTRCRSGSTWHDDLRRSLPRSAI